MTQRDTTALHLGLYRWSLGLLRFKAGLVLSRESGFISKRVQRQSWGVLAMGKGWSWNYSNFRWHTPKELPFRIITNDGPLPGTFWNWKRRRLSVAAEAYGISWKRIRKAWPTEMIRGIRDAAINYLKWCYTTTIAYLWRIITNRST